MKIAMDSKNKKTVKFLAKLLVSLGFVAWLVFSIDWREVLFYVGKIKAWQVGLYYAVLIAGMLISSYKWKKLAAFKEIKLPFADFFKFYLAGTFVNNFMPSFIGGDTFRAYQIGKPEKKYKEAASTVIADRITGLLGAMLLALFFSLLNSESIARSEILVLINFVVLGAVFCAAALLLAKKISFWKKIPGFLPEKISEFIRILNGYTERGMFSKAMLYSFVFGLVGLAASNYVLFFAFGAEINILDYLSVIFLVSIVSSIPVSINNIGIKEWAYVTFFGFFGISGSLVVTIALLSRILQMMLSFFALPLYLRSKDGESE